MEKKTSLNAKGISPLQLQSLFKKQREKVTSPSFLVGFLREPTPWNNQHSESGDQWEPRWFTHRQDARPSHRQEGDTSKPSFNHWNSGGGGSQSYSCWPPGVISIFHEQTQGKSKKTPVRLEVIFFWWSKYNSRLKKMRWNYLWFWWPLMRTTSFSPAWHWKYWKLGIGGNVACHVVFDLPCRMSCVFPMALWVFPDFRNFETWRPLGVPRFLLWVFCVFAVLFL